MDKLGEGNVDLLKEHPFVDILEEAEKHSFDAAHAGFPCGSFSKARYNEGHGPKPVRSLEHMYGLPSNSSAQQKEADRGTILAVRSVEIVKAVIKSQRRRRVPQAGTLENPPGSESQFEGPAWKLPEVVSFMEKFRLETAIFNTCSYMSKQKVKWYKPGRFSGALDGLGSLARKCTCPSWVVHESLVGKEKTSKAAQYPEELAECYARLIINAFKLTVQLEWWRHMLKVKKEEVSSLQQKWLESKEKKQLGYDKALDFEQPSKRAWSAENTETDSRPESDHPSKKARREMENEAYVGGMRNPARAVMMFPRIANVGKDIMRLWSNFVGRYPEALEVARTYGSAECKPKEEILEAWTNEVSKVFKVKNTDEVIMREAIEYVSPLNIKLWEAWQKASGDPEVHVVDWMKRGAPLGMEVDIPRCGIYPETDELQGTGQETPEVESQLQVENYKSVTEATEDANIEIQRYVDAGFCLRLSDEEVKALFPRGTISRLALIVKCKEGGAVKRRIIIDLLRSGGNDRARINERIVLPRVMDIIESIRMLRYFQSQVVQEHPEGDQEESEDDDGEVDDLEMVTADLSDAYCHFAVRREELMHCLSPSTVKGEHLCFRAMLFGFRGAPLIMGRFAAMLARCLQSCTPLHQMNMQIYMDDPCMIFQGDARTRQKNLALVLYMCSALGVKLAYHKGARGKMLTWIGVQFELRLAEKVIAVTIPQKMLREIVGTLESWEKAGMVSVRELRATTGRLSWVAGILTRCRWAVSIMYAVLASSIKDNEKEIQRAMQRKDKRPKLGMVPVKRLELPRLWFMRMLQDADRLALRKEDIEPRPPAFAIITDASPRGVGAILCEIDKTTLQLTVLEALESPVTKSDAEMLGVEWDSHRSQGPLEGWAILLALRTWYAHLTGKSVVIRSDSMVALAMAKKMAGGSPTLNWID